MVSSHGPSWAQEIHRQPIWRCNDHVETNDIAAYYSFSSYSEFRAHILVLHPENTQLLDNEMRNETQPPIPDEPRPLGLCPLCLHTVQSSRNSDEIAISQDETKTLGTVDLNLIPALRGKEYRNKSKRRVTFANTLLSATDSGTTSSKLDDNEEESPSTSFELGLHVAAHLQFLTTLSLRLMVNLGYDDDDEPQNDSGKSAIISLGSEDVSQDSVSTFSSFDMHTARDSATSSKFAVNGIKLMDTEEFHIDAELKALCDEASEEDLQALAEMHEDPTNDDQIEFYIYLCFLRFQKSRFKESEHLEKAIQRAEGWVAVTPAHDPDYNRRYSILGMVTIWSHQNQFIKEEFENTLKEL